MFVPFYKGSKNNIERAKRGETKQKALTLFNMFPHELKVMIQPVFSQWDKFQIVKMTLSFIKYVIIEGLTLTIVHICPAVCVM